MPVPFAERTVVVTGASGRVGSALLPRLQSLGAHTIALVRTAGPTSSAGEVVEQWMTNPAALDALRRADIVVHLAGELFARTVAVYHEAHVATTERILSGIRAASPPRLITLSYLGADPASPNAYLRTNGERDRLLQQHPAPAVIFRCPALINRPDDPGPFEQAITAPPNGPAQMLGDGRQRIQPIYRGDVVEAILAACTRGQPGVYDLAGPDEMSIDDLIRLINRTPAVPIRHVPGWLARVLSLVVPDLPPTYVDLALRDCVGDPRRAIQTFGLTLTPLHTLWPPLAAPAVA